MSSMDVGIAVSKMPVEYSETRMVEDAAKLLLLLAVNAVLGGLRVPIGPQDFEGCSQILPDVVGI